MILWLRGEYFVWRLGPPVEYSKATEGGFRLRIPAQPFSPHWDDWKFAWHDNPFRHLVSTSLFLAHFDETVKHMLVFLGVNGPTWISLYAIKDFIVKAGWNEKRMAEGACVEESEIKRFRQTANNFEAIGPFARHGEKGWRPPCDPMTLEEAQVIICNCVEAFFKERAQAVDLKQKFEEKTR